MAPQAQTLQLANPGAGTVSRAPQTTAAPDTGAGNVPFARLSREGSIPGPSQSGVAFGSLLTPILKPVGGYLKVLTITLTATGGTGAAAVASADAPYNTIQNLFLRDPYGQPIVQASGYGIYLINLYSGQVGMLGFGNNPATLPNFSAIATTGNFTVQLYVPMQLDSSGYCSLPSQNAASQPQLQVQLNPSTTVYTGAPTTVPTLNVAIDEPFWMAPVDNPQVGPPDVGSSAQWSEARAAAGVASASYQRIQLPRVGTFIHTLALTLRDATGARIDAWPAADLSLWIDGVPVIMETFAERVNIMYAQFGVTRPTGVIVYSWRDAVQSAVSGADTYDKLLPTTPATLLEVAGTFGTIASAPAQIIALTGELFPAGGIPYTHLAS